MKRNPNLDPLPGLPPELAELDAELSELQLDERPSFGPELRNELARDWGLRVAPRPLAWRRHALAATLAALAFTGIAVPPARASLVEGVQRIFETLRGEGPVAEPVVPPPPTRELRLEEGAVTPEPAEPAPDASPEVAAPGAVDLPPFQPGNSSLPALVDEAREREMIRSHYPRALQEVGIGGSVNLLLWVGEDGAVDNVQVARGSGVPELDRAALQAAPGLRFRPALRGGVPVGMWVEFDVVFEPPPQFRILPAPEVLETPMIPAVAGWQPPDSWTEAAVIPAPVLVESREMLRLAMGGRAEALEAAFGPLEGILNGEAPAGEDVLRWRTRVTRALEEARARDPENPAPYLALARIRRKQGLRNDAQMLFQEGLKRAARGTRPVSPRLVAELAFESGRLARENWLGWREVGEIAAEDLPADRCPQAGASPGEVVPVETLLVWNYACAAELDAVMPEAFRPRAEGERLRSDMLRSFVAAVESYPAHVGANTEILLDLADRESWHPLLEGARRFAWASQGHPHALLMEGLALHRLGRSEEAAERFALAFRGLPDATAREFRAPEFLGAVDGSEAAEARWQSLDPIFSTRVNEREVEHWARAGYALLRFGALEADAARIWVRYGRPGAVRTFGAGSGLRLEMWDYGQGPDLTFHRPATSQNGALTPEAEAYLGDLMGTVPHWYGRRARPVLRLPAQVARFRGAEPGTSALRIRFDLPEEFREAAAASGVQVGVFLVGSGGPVREAVRFTIRDAGQAVNLLVPADGEVREAVVEVHDPASGTTAGSRTMLEPGEPSLSDLLLVEPARLGRSRLGRRGDGLRPRPWSARLGGDDVGIFLELYELPREGSYRVRAELVSARTGVTVPLAVRPAGESRFQDGWVREAIPGTASPEFLVADLRGVGPGPYTLRVQVELEDGLVLARELPGLDRGPGVTDPPPAGAFSTGG